MVVFLTYILMDMRAAREFQYEMDESRKESTRSMSGIPTGDDYYRFSHGEPQHAKRSARLVHECDKCSGRFKSKDDLRMHNYWAHAY
jgi:hypothetical protein